MAQNISLLGADYPDVPAVQLPKTGGGTATFTDVSDTDAAAGDVRSGKKFYTANGVRETGTMAAFVDAYPSNVYWNSPVTATTGEYTATDDGIMIITAVTDSSAGNAAFLYIYDATTGWSSLPVLRMAGNANGLSMCHCFPVIKGHTYKTSAVANMSGIDARLIKFN